MLKKTGPLKVSVSPYLRHGDFNPSVALNEAIKADHGFNVESRTIRNLVEIMSEFEAPTRRHYLQFLTGSPKLPIGG